MVRTQCQRIHRACKRTMKNASILASLLLGHMYLRTHVFVDFSNLYGAAVTASTSFLCVCLLHRIANAVHAPIAALMVLFLFLLSTQAKQTCALLCVTPLEIAYRYHIGLNPPYSLVMSKCFANAFR